MIKEKRHFAGDGAAFDGQRGAYTVNAFCEWADIGRSTFYLEVRKGRLKLRKIGRKSVVTASDAMDWLNALPLAA